MASAEGETDNGVATVKKAELKLVQTVKKITSQVDCELILTENELSWKWQPSTSSAAQTKGKEETQTKANKTNTASTEESVRISWVLRAKVETAKATEKPEGEENGETSSELIIHYIKRHEQPEFRYSMAQAKFSGPTNMCTEWETVLTDQVAKTAPQRPKSLLVIINPVSGYKKGEKIYRDKVAPIFEIAGINTEVVVTKKPKESAEIFENHDLNKFDGVVSVGGDGTHTEVGSALLEKTLKAAGVEEMTPTTDLQPPIVKLGMIPTGSGNGQQLGCSYSRDVITCALVIVLGDNRCRSVASIHCGEKFLAYSYLLIGYGFLSQVMELMENNKWAGPARYLALAFITLVKRKAVEVQLDYLPGDEESHADFEIFSEIKHNQEKSAKGSSVDPPATGPAGGAETEEKETNQAEGADTEQKTPGQAEGADTEEKAASPADGDDSEQKGSNETAATTTEEKGQGEADGANSGEAKGEASSEQPKSEETEEKEKKTEKGAEAAAVEEVEEATPDPLPEGWKRVSGKFLGIDCFAHRIDKLDMAHLYMMEDSLDDSVLGLSITQPCGRLEHVKHMRRLQKGDLKKSFSENGFVKALGVKAFRIKAIGEWRNSSKANAIDWDGDMLYSPEPHFEVRCHPGVMPTFTRNDGPELKRICIEEEERKKAAIKAEQERKEQAAREKKEAAAAAASAKAAEKKAAEVTEEKPAEVDGKPSEGEAKSPESGESKPVGTEDKPADGEPAAAQEGGQKEAEEDLPKAEVEIKVTEAPETDSQ